MQEQSAQPVLTAPDVQLDSGLVWNIVGEISKPIQAELRASIDENDQNDLPFIRQHLATYYPSIFVACDAIEQAYVHANSLVNAQAQRVIAIAKYSVVTEAKREVREASKDKRAGKRTRVDEDRKAAGFDAYNVLERDRQKAFAQYYSRRDLWSPDEYDQKWMDDYAIVGSKIAPAAVLCQYETYKTIYHCTGKWGMETLMEILSDEGHSVIGLRNDTQKFEDCLRYKVVSSESFEGVE